MRLSLIHIFFPSGSRVAEEILLTLTEQNAFVTRLPDGKTFRFHHMLKECAVRLFDRLTPEKQDACRERYGRGLRQSSSISMP